MVILMFPTCPTISRGSCDLIEVESIDYYFFFFNTSLVEKIDSVVFQFSGVESEEHSLFFFFFFFTSFLVFR